MTIYDIAQEAGVSASTVSRVLNKKKGVNQQTRQKVEKLLKKYHFEPNASAQGLVSQSSKVIGIMVSDIRTLHHAEGVYFIEQQLQKHGYSCIIVNSGFTEQSRENGMRLLASRRAEAIVLIGSTFQTESTKKNIRKYLRSLPIIIENGFIDLPNVYSVLADERHGVAECLRLLYSKGKQSPCYINMDNTPSNSLKIQGFCSVWQEYHPDGGEAPIVQLAREPDTDEWQCCYQAVLRLIQEQPHIDSIIFSTDLLANAGVRALMDSGLRIPDQVAVIGVDNSIYAKLAQPQLTTLDNRLQELSITCSNMLLRILNNEQVAHQLTLPSNIVERETT